MGRKAIRRDYISFDLIRTDQEVVRSFRLETFKNFIKDGKVDYITPVSVIEFNEDVFHGYLLLDGNHRARATYDTGQPCVWALVLESRKEDVINRYHGREIKELKITNMINKEDNDRAEWNPKYKKKNKLFSSE